MEDIRFVFQSGMKVFGIEPKDGASSMSADIKATQYRLTMRGRWLPLCCCMTTFIHVFGYIG